MCLRKALSLIRGNLKINPHTWKVKQIVFLVRIWAPTFFYQRAIAIGALKNTRFSAIRTVANLTSLHPTLSKMIKYDLKSVEIGVGGGVNNLNHPIIHSLPSGQPMCVCGRGFNLPLASNLFIPSDSENLCYFAVTLFTIPLLFRALWYCAVVLPF